MEKEPLLIKFSVHFGTKIDVGVVEVNKLYEFLLSI